MTFDKISIDKIHREMEAALQPVAAKHGITIVQGGGNYGDLDATLKFRLRTHSETGETQEVLDFKQYAGVFGVPAAALGQTITLSDGGTYKVIGLAPRRRKFPVVIENILTGKRKVATIEAVVSKLTVKMAGAK